MMDNSKIIQGLGKPIFTINLPYGGKKSVLITDLDVTVKSVLDPIFKQRNMVLEDYIAMKNDGRNIDFNTKLNAIDGPLELIITGANDVFTVFLPHGGKKSVVLNPTQTLRSLCEKVCSHRNMRIDEIMVTAMDGKPCDLDVTLAFMSERSVIILSKSGSEDDCKPDGFPQKKKSILPHIHIHQPRKRDHDDPDESSSSFISPRLSLDSQKGGNGTLKKKKISTSRHGRLKKISTSKKSGPGSDSDSENNTDFEEITSHNTFTSRDHHDRGDIHNLFINSQDPTTSSAPLLLSPREPFKIPLHIWDLMPETEFTPYPFPVFEVALEKLGTSENPIPYIVRCIIKYLLCEEGILSQGLFRIPGSTEEIQYYKKLFDEGKEVLFTKSSYHDVAGLLKEFFRKLPEPLIPHFYDMKVKSYVEEHKAKEIDDHQLLNNMKMILEQLPKENLRTLQLLILFLSIIASYSDINMMTLDNIIKCIVPSVGCIPAIFYYTVNNYDFFFSSDKSAAEPTMTGDPERRGRVRRGEQGSRYRNPTRVIIPTMNSSTPSFDLPTLNETDTENAVNPPNTYNMTHSMAATTMATSTASNMTYSTSATTNISSSIPMTGILETSSSDQIVASENEIAVNDQISS
jgi:hypothetical protein